METINVNEIKAKFFCELYEDYKNFLSSYKISENISSFIKDSRESDPEMRDRLLKVELSFNHLNEEDIQQSVEEFFDIIKDEESFVTNIASIIVNFKGEPNAFRSISTEDKIVKAITRYFWEKLKDPMKYDKDKKLYQKGGGLNKTTINELKTELNKSNNTIGDKEIKEILSKPTVSPGRYIRYDNNPTFGYLNIIQNGLLNGTKWVIVGDLLRIRHYLRNYTAGHSAGKIDKTLVKIAKENILFTYIATTLALRQSLIEKGDIDDSYEWPKRELYVFFSPKDEIQERLGFHLIDDSGEEVRPEEIYEDYYRYILDKSKSYSFRVSSPESIPVPDNSETRCLQIAMWNGYTFDFSNRWESINSNNYPNLTQNVIKTIISTGKKISDSITTAIKDQTERYVKGLNEVRTEVKQGTKWNKYTFFLLLACLVIILFIYLFKNTDIQKPNSSSESKAIVFSGPYEQSYNVDIIPWSSSLFRSFISDSITNPKAESYSIDSLGYMTYLKLVGSQGGKILEYTCPNKRTIISKYMGTDSVAIADFDEINQLGLPTSGHLEIGNTLEALSFDADYDMNADQSDLEYIRFVIYTSTAIDLYDNTEKREIPEGWGGKNRSIVIRYIYNKYSNLDISNKFRDILFCPDLLNTIIPGGIGFSIGTRIGKLAHHIPDYCNIEIEDIGLPKKYYRLEFIPQTNNKGEIEEMAYTLRLYGDSSDYGSNNSYDKFITYRLPSRHFK